MTRFLPRLRAPLVALGLALVFALSSTPAEARPVQAFNAVCPAMPDEAVDPSITATHEGVTIAFCCKGCRRDFLADPGAMIAGMPADMRAQLEAQVEAEPIVALPPVVSSAVRPASAGAEGEGAAPRWKVLAGRLHPLAVHFPIALLLAAVFAEFLAGSKRTGVARDGARFCLRLGVVSAVASVLLGLAAHATIQLPDAVSDVVRNHNLSGYAALGLAVLALVLQMRSDRTPDSRGARRIYVFVLFLTGVAVVVTGHLGGTLVFGRDHLSVF